jgi:hypothetical protein
MNIKKQSVFGAMVMSRVVDEEIKFLERATK